MTKQNILQELGNCIRQNLRNQKYLEIQNIAFFLLGETDSEKGTLSRPLAYKIYKGDRSLSMQQISRLMHLPAARWNITESYLFDDRLNNSENLSQLNKDITKLFEKYYPDAPLPLSTHEMIQSLVITHFIGTDEEYILFNTNDKCFRSNYAPWKAKEERLFQLLKKHNLVFVTGLPASGKTQLVRYFIHKYDKRKNIFRLDIYPDNPLSDRIKYIDFIDGNINPSAANEDTIDTILSCLQAQTSFSALLIDIPLITENDYAFIKKHLIDMELRIIITTRTTDIPSSYASINLDNRPIKNLLHIFKLYCPKVPIANNDFSKLCRIISYNPYIMSLIAKCFSTNVKNSEASSKQFDIEKLLNIEAWHLDLSPEIHSSYHRAKKGSPSSIEKLAARILEYYDDKFLQDAGSKLSILAKDEIPQSILEEEVSLPDIKKAMEIGILQYTDHKENILQMPSIIADIIWQKYPIDYKDYKEQIFHILNNISEGQKLQQSYKFLYRHVITMIYRFHFQITKLKTRPQKKDKDTFIEWNQILSEIIQCFIKLGNTADAQNILYRLYVYENKKGEKEGIVSSYQLLDKEIFQLHIDFANNASPIEILEKAVQFLSKLSPQDSSSLPAKQFFPLLEKVYIFIMDTLDTLLLKQIISPCQRIGPTIEAKLLNDTLTCLCSILSNNLLIDNRILCYYQMIYNFLSCMRKYSMSNIHIANKCFLYLIDSDSETNTYFNLSFKARIWKLYYDIRLPLEKFDGTKEVYTYEQLLSFTQEYTLLYNEFDNDICSFNTSILFYYCSLTAYPLLQFFPDTDMNSILENICNTIVNQSNLSKKEKEKLFNMFHQMVSTSTQFNLFPYRPV